MQLVLTWRLSHNGFECFNKMAGRTEGKDIANVGKAVFRIEEHVRCYLYFFVGNILLDGTTGFFLEQAAQVVWR